MRILTWSRVATLGILALGILASVVAPVEAQSPVTVGILSRFAGGGSGTIVDGGSADAGPMFGSGLALDPSGNMYVSEGTFIWRINVGSHTITLVAGTGVAGYRGDGGPATLARLNDPRGLALDAAGNLYIADYGNHRVRKVEASTGIITTIAGNGTAGSSGRGGLATLAQLNNPIAVALDSAGNVYISNYGDRDLRKVNASTQVITSIGSAGSGLAVDGAGNVIIAANYPGGRIARLLDEITGNTTTLAGRYDAPRGADPMIATDVAIDTFLSGTTAVTVDAHGDIYFGDATSVHKLTVATGRLTMIAGSGGSPYGGSGGAGGLATAALLGAVKAIVVDAAGAVYIACQAGLMKVDTPTPSPVMSTVAGTGNAEGGPYDLQGPQAAVVDASGNIFIADTADHSIKKRTAAGVLSVYAGIGVPGFSGDGGNALTAQLNSPRGLAVDAVGNLFVADTENHSIRKISANGTITTVAGSGIAGFSGDGGLAIAAQLKRPRAVALDPANNNLYVADAENYRVRKVDATTGLITTLAGTGTQAGSTTSDAPVLADSGDLSPVSVAVDTSSNLFILSYKRIRRVDATTGVMTNYAGMGDGYLGEMGEYSPATESTVQSAQSLCIDGAGNVFVAGGRRIREIDAATGIIHTVAGNDSLFKVGGDGWPSTVAPLLGPAGCSVDAQGNVYIADTTARYIRRSGQPVSLPGAFRKLAPANAAPGQATNPTLRWEASSGATRYEYCIDVSWDLCHAWISTGTSTSVLLSGLGANVQYSWQVRAINGGGTTWADGAVGAVSIFWPAEIRPFRSDFDGDRKADLMVYRPSTGEWYVRNSRAGVRASNSYRWGLPGDQPEQGDFDGDGAPDLAVYRPTTGEWWILWSRSNFLDHSVFGWGLVGDLPVPADYDGDGKTDIAVYRPSTGAWWILKSSTDFSQYDVRNWGLPGDVPVVGDYDGDAKADPAIYRAVTGEWWVLKSSTDFSTYLTYTWGLDGDSPVPADYDGDGKIDIAVYRRSSGNWWILWSRTNYLTHSTYWWGLSGDVPVPADYDGDGKTDIAVFRPTTAEWWILKSSSNFASSSVYNWGLGEDIPFTQRTVVAAPTNLTATQISQTEIRLQWTPSFGATSYVVKRGVSPATETVYAAGVGTTLFISAGTLGTRYYFVVSAINGGVESNDTSEVSVVMMTAPTPIAAPTSVSATRISATQIRLDWAPVAGATSYNVKRGLEPGGETTLANGLGTTTFVSTGTVGTRYYFLVSAVNEIGEGTNSSEVSALLTTRTGADFNGDGSPDLLWRNAQSGATVVWYLNAGAVTGQTALSPEADQTWQLIASADFTQDGQPDILWHNTATGANAVWAMNADMKVLGEYALQGLPDLSWRLATTADINGDGSPDLLWRNYRTGDDFVWYMNGLSVMGGGSLPVVPDVRWELVASADMNQDGAPDLIWRNRSTGRNRVWYLNGASLAGQADLPSVVDPTWELVAAQDATGDFLPDLIWRNSATGSNIVWAMNGATLVDQFSLPTVSDLTWSMAGPRLRATPSDLNGDRRSDLVWHNTVSGRGLVWYMDGTTVLSQEPVTGTDSLSWRLSAIADINGDSRPDLIWRTGSNGWIFIRLLNGTETIDSGMIPTTGLDRDWDIVGASDVNRDGFADLIWRHVVTGQNMVWYLRKWTLLASESLPSVTDITWQIQGTSDLNGDSSPDLVWRNTATGGNTIWFMNGTTLVRQANLPAEPDQNWQMGSILDIDGDTRPDLVWRNAATGAVVVWYLNGDTVLGQGSLPSVPDTTWTLRP